MNFVRSAVHANQPVNKPRRVSWEMPAGSDTFLYGASQFWEAWLGGMPLTGAKRSTLWTDFTSSIFRRD